MPAVTSAMTLVEPRMRRRESSMPLPEIDDSMYAQLFQPWPSSARTWFRGVMKKTMVGYVVYLCAFALILAFLVPDYPLQALRDGDGDGPSVPQATRVRLTAYAAFVAVASHLLEAFLFALPAENDRWWRTLRDGAFGHFDYLTMHIEVLNAAYWLLSLVGELAWMQFDHPPRLLVRCLVLAYTMSSFCNALATMLTVLFLAFVWCDPQFQRDVEQSMEARGNATLKYKVLFTHCNQIPFALLDALLIKQTKLGLLARVAPTLGSTLACCAAYNATYAVSLHVNFRKNGGLWTYTFQDDAFRTTKGELSFLVSMTMANCIVIAAYHGMAVGLPMF